MNNLIIQTSSLEDTDSLAKIISQLIGPETVIALNGDLGSGKTTFSKDLVKYCGNSEIVTSPTFTILNIYEGNPKFYHFDFYRLETLEDIENIGGTELIPALDGITIIEWSEKIPEIMPEKYLKINIKFVDENTREFQLKAIGNIIDLNEVKQAWQF